MSDPQPTLMEILNKAHRYLEDKGIESPRRSAEAMMGKVLGLSRIDLYLQHDRPLTPQQISAYRELMRRRAQHEPLQYILGTVEFCGVNLEVVPGLLIPRPETEELADWLASEISTSSAGSPIRMLDIGTGTGCLAVAIAARVLNVQVDAVDVDFEALHCTMRNAAANGVGNRVRSVAADLFSEKFLSMVAPPYDVVVSNPPYVTAMEYPALAAEVRDFEPRHALVADNNGLAFYQRIAMLLPALLKPEGLLAVEAGAGQSADVKKLFECTLNPITVRTDLAGIPRIVTGKLLVTLPSNLMSS